ncbi:MAG TPA: hypothetical protein EYP14_19960 [Planctomycetaceae bacterium]|nr:hypothetical protein [Planctomycetaceae bacterium]
MRAIPEFVDDDDEGKPPILHGYKVLEHGFPHDCYLNGPFDVEEEKCGVCCKAESVPAWARWHGSCNDEFEVDRTVRLIEREPKIGDVVGPIEDDWRLHWSGVGYRVVKDGVHDGYILVEKIGATTIMGDLDVPLAPAWRLAETRPGIALVRMWKLLPDADVQDPATVDIEKLRYVRTKHVFTALNPFSGGGITGNPVCVMRVEGRWVVVALDCGPGVFAIGLAGVTTTNPHLTRRDPTGLE